MFLFEKKEPGLNRETAKPFLKWAGGKSQLLEQLENLLPKEVKNGESFDYCEPFVGGGAMFFFLAQNYKIRNSYLSDVNEELILAYRVVQKDLEKLVGCLAGYHQKYLSLTPQKREELFYKTRENYNLTRLRTNHKNYSETWILRASQMIFLNKTCFNGLFRLNQKGEFNVPFGGYEKPKILDETNLRKVSELLQNTEIFALDFAEIKNKVSENSFVYLDPPYRPISKTSGFTSYSKFDFSEKEQVRLANFFRELDKKGSKQLLSNSDGKDDFFEKLYEGFSINKVLANRMINSNGEKRGKIDELVIKNY